MLQRWSYLSGVGYSEFLQQMNETRSISNDIHLSTQGMHDGPVKALVQANLVSGTMAARASTNAGMTVANAVKDGTVQTVGAIHDQTRAAAVNTIATIGAIAVATHVITGRLDRVVLGIDRLGFQFTEGLALVVSKLDVQSKRLENITAQLEKIHETLNSPLLTQAAELRKLGLQRMARGLYPEAIESFRHALEKDKTDPVSWSMLGKIHLDGVNDPATAANDFQHAERYAAASLDQAPDLQGVLCDSLYLRAVAFLVLSAQSRNKKQTADEHLRSALKTVTTLVNAFPKHGQGRYLKAKLLLLLVDEIQAEVVFRELCEDDASYVSAALRDPDFAEHTVIGKRLIASQEPSVRHTVKSSFEEILKDLSRLRRWNIAVPNEVKSILLAHGLAGDETGQATLSEMTYEKLVNPELPVLSTFKKVRHILQTSLTRINSSIAGKFETLLTALPGEIRNTKWAFVQDSLTRDPRLKTQESREQFLATLRLDESTFEQQFSDLSKLLAEVRVLCAKANEINAVLVKARAEWKVIKSKMKITWSFMIFVVIICFILPLGTISSEYFSYVEVLIALIGPTGLVIYNIWYSSPRKKLEREVSAQLSAVGVESWFEVKCLKPVFDEQDPAIPR